MENQNNSTTQYVLDTIMRKQRQIKLKNTRALLQTNGGKDEPNIVSLLHVEGIIRRMYTGMSYTHC